MQATQKIKKLIWTWIIKQKNDNYSTFFHCRKVWSLIILFKLTPQRGFTSFFFYHSKPPLSSSYSFSSEIWLKVTGSHRPFKTLFDATWCPCQRIKGTVLIKRVFFCSCYGLENAMGITQTFIFNSTLELFLAFIYLFFVSDKRLWKWPH